MTQSLLFEEIEINLLNFILRDRRHTNVVFEHELRELRSVDQHDLRIDVRDELVRIGAETRGRGEHTLTRPLPL